MLCIGRMEFTNFYLGQKQGIFLRYNFDKGVRVEKASKAQCIHTFLHSTDQFELFHFQLMRMIVESRSILIQLLQGQSITDCRSGQSTAARLAAVPRSTKFMLCLCRTGCY